MSSNRGRRSDIKNSSQIDGHAQDGNDDILQRLEIMINGNLAKLNQILSQNIEMKNAISSITISKSSLQFMDGTVNELKEDMCQRVELGVSEAFENDVVDKLDDLENRKKRNNLVFGIFQKKVKKVLDARLSFIIFYIISLI